MNLYSYEPVTKARLVHDYVIEFTFADGLKREIDMEPFLHGGVFEELKLPAHFKNFRVDQEAGTIVWANGADIAPETLYHDLGPVRHEVE